MIELQEPYAIAWAGWGIAFLIIEGFALFNKQKGDTLSEHVWQIFSIKHKGKMAWTRRGGLIAFMIWLFIHFVSGGVI